MQHFPHRRALSRHQNERQKASAVISGDFDGALPTPLFINLVFNLSKTQSYCQNLAAACRQTAEEVLGTAHDEALAMLSPDAALWPSGGRIAQGLGRVRDGGNVNAFPGHTGGSGQRQDLAEHGTQGFRGIRRGWHMCANSAKPHGNRMA